MSKKRPVVAQEVIDLLDPRSKELVMSGHYYFTNKPCIHGHLAIRSFKNRNCRACIYIKEQKRDKQKARDRSLRANWKRNKMPKPTRDRPTNCELCGGPPTARRLHLDHDRRTGRFRGWLCHYCNTNLGRFGDNVEGLMRAVKYLEVANEEFRDGSYTGQ